MRRISEQSAGDGAKAAPALDDDAGRAGEQPVDPIGRGDPGPPSRHRLERPLWTIAVITNATAVAFIAAGLAGLDRLPDSLSSGPWDELIATILVVVLVWPAWAAARSRMDEAWALGSSLPPVAGAAIVDLADDIARRLGLWPPPGLRLLANGPTRRQPTVIAWGNGPLLVDRMLVDALWPAHPRILAFVIAYGMAGIRLGHTRRADAVLLGLAAGIPVLGGWLERTQVASRDRLAAWIAPDGAAALTLLATGNTRWDEVSLDDLRVAAAAAPGADWRRIASGFGEPDPLLVRVAALDRMGLLPAGVAVRPPGAAPGSERGDTISPSTPR